MYTMRPMKKINVNVFVNVNYGLGYVKSIDDIGDK